MKRIAGKKFEYSKVDLLMNELVPGKNMNVPDPWYGPEPGYHEVYQLIDKVCDQIITKYSPTLTPRPPLAPRRQAQDDLAESH